MNVLTVIFFKNIEHNIVHKKTLVQNSLVYTEHDYFFQAAQNTVHKRFFFYIQSKLRDNVLGTQ